MNLPVKERPILFSAPMVRALLDGTKTQTRRIVKPRDLDWMDEHQGLREADNAVRCPYGKPGDRLWVRETWARVQLVEVTSGRPTEGYEYKAGRMVLEGGREPAVLRTEPTFTVNRWRPSIHMPRAASRITLEVTGVRVERLQDISEADAKAEGVERHRPGVAADVAYRAPYRWLWDEINSPGSWDANPWVWVIEFRRI